jgi:hypothetical protein
MQKTYYGMLKVFLNSGFDKYPENTLLNYKILKNHQHPLTKFILYLHTLETFLY